MPIKICVSDSRFPLRTRAFSLLLPFSRRWPKREVPAKKTTRGYVQLLSVTWERDHLGIVYSMPIGANFVHVLSGAA